MSRLKYLGQRLAMAVPVMVFGLSITFLGIRASPIDPAAAILGPEEVGTPEYDALRQRLGLNEPLWTQYVDFMVDMFTLNLGQSWVISPGTSTWDLVGIYAPRTIWMGFWAVLIAVFIGIPLGFYAGLRPNTWADYFASMSGIVWRAMPNFWLAIILVSLLSQSGSLTGGAWSYQSWLVNTKIVTSPNLGFFREPMAFVTAPGESWPALLAAFKQIIPASIVLGSASMGNEMRIGRTAILETINSNYVETAKAKGVPPRVLIWKHVFRNAMIPLVPIITGEAFLLIGGSVLVEMVFAVHGLGYLFFQAAILGDIPLLASLMFIFIAVIVLLNLLQDALYTIIDPRIGYSAY